MADRTGSTDKMKPTRERVHDNSFQGSISTCYPSWVFRLAGIFIEGVKGSKIAVELGAPLSIKGGYLCLNHLRSSSDETLRIVKEPCWSREESQT
jgi:hypothetical protein